MDTPQCTMCSNESTWRCATCKSSTYCSQECGEADWPIHKLLCNHVQNFATPPNASTKRGIYFPVDQLTPHFVWVPTVWIPQKDEYTPGSETMKLKPYIGDDAWESIGIRSNVIRSRKRNNLIELFMRDTAVDDKSAPNLSIAELTGGVAFRPWCGSMLAMKAATRGDDSGQYLHMDTVDFRDVVDLFRSHNSKIPISDMDRDEKHKGPVSPIEEKLKQEAAALEPSWQMNFGRTATPDVPGVRISCVRDPLATYKAVKVKSTDPVWNAPVTSIFNLVGMPVKVRRIRDNDEANPEATFLHLNTHLKNEYWGYPWEWQWPAESALVVYADRKKAISSNQVETLCSYCQNVLQPLLKKSAENPWNMKLKYEIFRNLSPSSFTEYHSISKHVDDMIQEPKQ